MISDPGVQTQTLRTTTLSHEENKLFIFKEWLHPVRNMDLLEEFCLYLFDGELRDLVGGRQLVAEGGAL